MRDQDTLTPDRVAESFRQWREQKQKTKGMIRTPETLQQQAVSLLLRYPVSRIIKTLGINHRQISAWRARWQPQTAPQAPVSDTFVALEPQVTMPVAETESPLALKLTATLACGMPLAVEGALPLTQWRAVVSLFNATGG